MRRRSHIRRIMGASWFPRTNMMRASPRIEIKRLSELRYRPTLHYGARIQLIPQNYSRTGKPRYSPLLDATGVILTIANSLAAIKWAFPISQIDQNRPESHVVFILH